MTSLQHLTWEEYCDQVGIANVLTAGANACYAAKTHKPEAYLAQFYRSNTSADVIRSVSASEVLDGCGGYTVSIEVSLTSGTALQRCASTTALLALHPSTNRRLAFSTTGSRGSTADAAAGSSAAAVAISPAPKDAKTAAAAAAAAEAKPKPPPPAQRYDAVAVFLSTSASTQLLGSSVIDQESADRVISAIDGTSTYSTVLAPTAACLSLIIARLGSMVLQRPLYRHVSSFASVHRRLTPGVPQHLQSACFFLPRPIVTVLSTEARYMGRVRIREVCLIPMMTSASTSSAAAATLANSEGAAQGPRCSPFSAFSSAKVITQLQAVFEFLQTKLDDPPTNTDGSIKYNGYEALPQVFELVEEAVKEVCGSAGALGTEYQLGLVVDGALSYRADTQRYAFVEGTDFSGAQLAEAVALLCKDKKVAYVEDALHENDTVEMRRLMHRVGGQMTVAANNTVAGDTGAIERYAKELLANNLVLRVSDHGTLSNTIQNANRFTQQYAGSTLTVTSDANECDGAALIDLAVALGARFVKVGGLQRPEHAAALNHLVQLQAELEQGNILVPPPLWDDVPLELPPAPLEPVQEVNAKDAKKKK